MFIGMTLILWLLDESQHNAICISIFDKTRRIRREATTPQEHRNGPVSPEEFETISDSGVARLNLMRRGPNASRPKTPSSPILPTQTSGSLPPGASHRRISHSASAADQVQRSACRASDIDNFAITKFPSCRSAEYVQVHDDFPRALLHHLLHKVAQLLARFADGQPAVYLGQNKSHRIPAWKLPRWMQCHRRIPFRGVQATLGRRGAVGS